MIRNYLWVMGYEMKLARFGDLRINVFTIRDNAQEIFRIFQRATSITVDSSGHKGIQ